MTEADLIELARGLPGVVAMTADEASGAPEAAWGDTFVFFDPDDRPEDRRMPFATIVTSDYEGFDTASDLNRPGVFRLNLAVGRESFEELLGYPPGKVPDGIDYTAFDQLIPHPIYASQSWVSIVNPGAATGDQAGALLALSHERARAGRLSPP